MRDGKMNSRICILIMIWAMQGFLGCFAAEKISLAGVKTNFVRDAVLSERDVTTVVKLAKDCGIKNVAEVFTFNMGSATCGIGVRGVEVVEGRQITAVNALVCSKKWGSTRSRRARDVVKSSGGFWIERGDVCTNVVTTFVTRTGVTRV